MLREVLVVLTWNETWKVLFFWEFFFEGFLYKVFCVLEWAELKLENKLDLKKEKPVLTDSLNKTDYFPSEGTKMKWGLNWYEILTHLREIW